MRPILRDALFSCDFGNSNRRQMSDHKTDTYTDACPCAKSNEFSSFSHAYTLCHNTDTCIFSHPNGRSCVGAAFVLCSATGHIRGTRMPYCCAYPRAPKRKCNWKIIINYNCFWMVKLRCALTFKRYSFLNFFGQYRHWHGDSSLCTIKCSFSAWFVVNDLPHSSHMNERSVL